VLLGEIDVEKTDPGVLGLTEVNVEDLREKQVDCSAEGKDLTGLLSR
jgi:hypothetical protein